MEITSTTTHEGFRLACITQETSNNRQFEQTWMAYRQQVCTLQTSAVIDQSSIGRLSIHKSTVPVTVT